MEGQRKAPTHRTPAKAGADERSGLAAGEIVIPLRPPSPFGRHFNRAVTPLRPPRHLVGVSIETERGCQQNGSLAGG